MDAVMRLLEELEDILDNSRGVPFSNKVAVDKEELYDIVSELRDCLPNDIKQSKIIVQERNKIIIEAQKEAEGIAKEAEDKMRRLIDEHEITKAAYAQSTEIVVFCGKPQILILLGVQLLLHRIQLFRLLILFFFFLLALGGFFLWSRGCSFLRLLLRAFLLGLCVRCRIHPSIRPFLLLSSCCGPRYCAPGPVSDPSSPNASPSRRPTSLVRYSTFGISFA